MHPIAFRIGSIEIYWYGILMALTFYQHILSLATLERGME